MRLRIIATVMASLLTMAVSGMALAADKAQPAKQTKVKRESVVTATATVQSIDLEKRIVTLMDAEEGNTFDLKVGPQARNLAQIEVGDMVTVKYYESIAYRLLKPGEKLSSALGPMGMPGNRGRGAGSLRSTTSAP